MKWASLIPLVLPATIEISLNSNRYTDTPNAELRRQLSAAVQKDMVLYG
jgi:hypothetical protein